MAARRFTALGIHENDLVGEEVIFLTAAETSPLPTGRVEQDANIDHSFTRLRVTK
jgi:hypothetical protein